MSLFTGEERRRSARMPSKRPLLIFVVGGDPRPVTAFTFSISAFGCAARCATKIAPGTRVLLDCDGKRMEGTVSFVLKNSALEGYELGIAFEQDGCEFWGTMF